MIAGRFYDCCLGVFNDGWAFLIVTGRFLSDWALLHLRFILCLGLRPHSWAKSQLRFSLLGSAFLLFFNACCVVMI
jgi:hypothetical protein